ncbi:uncharacterized protein LOC123548080 [Mercenaria mercenaria]|uniref:uncharacterized protein LOC123548080 n=1 Tax=Mercenaria mercenaria TaxID=6596 RepID=UPI00234EF20D|nr:uncharacterized protein LOC123548080 [Mercenaria mercenaria]
MNRKRLAAILILLIVHSLYGPCCSQSYGRHHHHHHDDYSRRGGGGVLSGLGTVLGIAGAGLLAGAITRGVTRGFSGGGFAYPAAYPQPVVPVAYPATTYPGDGYVDPYYSGGIRTMYRQPYVGGTAYGGSPIVGGTAYGGAYPGAVGRVRTVSDTLYQNVY